MKKVLVTGGGGFIGSFMVGELKKLGYEVDILDKANGDITDREMMLKTIPKYDVVYHLAGMLGTSELLDQSYEASRVNILGTINILDGALVNKTKVVEITKPNVWLNTYSITKYAAESFTRMYHEQFGLPTVSIKWYNVYGPNQSFHCQKAVPFFIRWALNNHPIEIWGNGEQTMDLIHAKDAVKATILVSNSDILGETVDIGSGEETSVIKLAKMIIDEVGNPIEIKHLPMRAGETPNTRLAADLTVLNSLGFKPEYNLEVGIKETVEWYKENLK